MVTLRSGSAREGPKIQIGFWTGPAQETNLEIYLPRKAAADLELDHSDLGDVRPRRQHQDQQRSWRRFPARYHGNVEIVSSDHGDTSHQQT